MTYVPKKNQRKSRRLDAAAPKSTPAAPPSKDEYRNDETDDDDGLVIGPGANKTETPVQNQVQDIQVNFATAPPPATVANPNPQVVPAGSSDDDAL